MKCKMNFETQQLAICHFWLRDWRHFLFPFACAIKIMKIEFYSFFFCRWNQSANVQMCNTLVAWIWSIGATFQASERLKLINIALNGSSSRVQRNQDSLTSRENRETTNKTVKIVETLKKLLEKNCVINYNISSSFPSIQRQSFVYEISLPIFTHNYNNFTSDFSPQWRS